MCLCVYLMYVYHVCVCVCVCIYVCVFMCVCVCVCVCVFQEAAGYSGSDLRLVCKEAAMRPVRKILHTLETPGQTDRQTGS